MMNYIPYLIKLSISLSIVYLFYQLCLRRLTFYNWNRWYLMLYSMICFLIPFIRIDTAPEQLIVQYIPVITDSDLTKHSTSFDWVQLYFVVVITGMVLFAIRLLVQWISLIQMRSTAKLLYDNDVKLYHIDKPVIPFSFGKAIYINQHQHSQQELSDIIRHEFIHVKQRHTVDMIWSELLCILNWYNPFAWLLRKSIRQNLEFIADNQVLESGFDRKQYQYLLLKVIGTPSYSIASNFNFSSLKKRIAMMNKTKSARVNLLRFVFILPLLSVIVLAFRTINHQERSLVLSLDDKPAKEVVAPAAFQNDLVADTTPKLLLKPIEKKKELVKPDEIKSMEVHKENGERIIIITLKNGEVDHFNFNNDNDRKRFAEKYGEPVPDPDPAPPVTTRLNDKGFANSIADNNGECVVIVKNDRGEIVKAVVLTEWDKNKEVYEQQYGPIPVKPVPPVSATPAKPGKPAALAAPVQDASPTIRIRSTRPASPATPATPTLQLSPAASPAPVRATAPAAAPVPPVPADTTALGEAFLKNFTNAVNHQVAIAHNTKKSYTPVFDLLITPTTTSEEFERIAEVLDRHGLYLKIEDAEYNNRMLMKFNVTFGGKHGGSGSMGKIDLSHGGALAVVGRKDEQGKQRVELFVKDHKPVL